MPGPLKSQSRRFAIGPLLRFVGLAGSIICLGYLAASSYQEQLRFRQAQRHLQQELHRLEDDVRRADWRRLKRNAARSNNIAEPVHLGEVVLVRKGPAYGAFIADEQGVDGAQGIRFVQYRWWYRADGKGRFDETDGNLHAGTDRAEGAFGPRSRGVKKKDIYVTFGPFKFEWSKANENWGWVYYDQSDHHDTRNRFCFTDRSEVRGLDALDPRWRYGVSAIDAGRTFSEGKK